ncbi:hypothetical protein ACFLV4_03435 [Chloroflexota bacterium]
MTSSIRFSSYFLLIVGDIITCIVGVNTASLVLCRGRCIGCPRGRDSDEIQFVHGDEFSLEYGTSGEKEDFKVKIYKIVYPGNVTSRLCLTANNRQVTETSLYRYIPEFKDNFYETDDNKDRNYIIRGYILGKYLNKHVSLERSTFNFPVEEADIVYPISQQAIEKEAAKIIENIFKDQVQVRRNKKIATIKNILMSLLHGISHISLV